jgi:hypothetical protein
MMVGCLNTSACGLHSLWPIENEPVREVVLELASERRLPVSRQVIIERLVEDELGLGHDVIVGQPGNHTRLGQISAIVTTSEFRAAAELFDVFNRLTANPTKDRHFLTAKGAGDD